MFDSILPEWTNMSEWLEPKLLVLMVFVATVLLLSRLGTDKRGEPKQLGQPQREDAAIIKNAQP